MIVAKNRKILEKGVNKVFETKKFMIVAKIEKFWKRVNKVLKQKIYDYGQNRKILDTPLFPFLVCAKGWISGLFTFYRMKIS